MKIDLAMMADYAIVDRYGKLSILGIFERVWIQQFPAVHPRVHLVLRLRGKRTEIGRHAVRIRLVDEDSREILGGNGSVDLAEPPAGVMEIEAGAVFVFDVPLQQPGKYQFEISVDSEHVVVPLIASVIPTGSHLGSEPN